MVRKVQRDDAPTSVDDDADDDPPMSALEEFYSSGLLVLFFGTLVRVLAHRVPARGRVQVARLAAQAVDENNRRVRALDRRDDDPLPRPAARELDARRFGGYFRYSELRHKPGELLEAVEKWWAWRRSYKPAGAGVQGV